MTSLNESKERSPSLASSATHAPLEYAEGVDITRVISPGKYESALPEDKKEEAIERVEDDWADDPRNPRNWSTGRKWTAAGVVSLYTFISPLASSMMAPGLDEISLKYGITNPTIRALTLTIFLLSFAIGPLILAPVSEIYGRTWVLHIANIFSIGFSLGCAFAPTTSVLIGMRFLAGLSGSAPIACGGGSIGDLFSDKDRGSAMALYSLGPLIGPVVGPIAGGFIASTIGVKYVFIVIACASTLVGVIGVSFLKETYAPVLRLRLAKKSSDPEKAARMHPALTEAHGDKLGVLWLNLSRPMVLLTRSFICFVLSLYLALMYGIYYLMFTTFPSLFSGTYGFSTGVGGLAYIGLGIGFLSATAISGKIGDKVYAHLSAKNGGIGKPEMRMPSLFFGSLFVPIGLFWYGWSAEAQLHWIMPIIGTGIFGFGMMTTFLPITLYLVDTFNYAASALAAASVLRFMFGFAFPLFGNQMFLALGLGGGNSLLAGLAIVIGIPFPVWIWYHGEGIRARSKYSN